MKSALLILPLAVCASLCHVATARLLRSGAREATLSGRCMTYAHETGFNITDDLPGGSLTLKGLRSTYVSMYRDGDVLAVYQLQEPFKSLAGCANACLLDWKMELDANATATLANTVPWSPSSDDIVPKRECEYFNFNIDNGKCTLISAQTSTQLTSSDRYWSGNLLCADLDNIQDWAEQVVA